MIFEYRIIRFWGQKRCSGIECQRRWKGTRLGTESSGNEKEDIHLDYKDGILTISGEKNEEKEEKDRDKYLRREFTSYSFHRSFELPEERYDVAKAQAAYKDGILEVTLPKKEQKDKVSRQIEVK